jgi:hypothetical protein
MSFGFIVPTCLRVEDHAKSLTECIQSIQTHNPGTKIVVIVDFSSSISLVEPCIKKFPTVVFEQSHYLVPADMLTFWFFLKNKYFDRACIIQDSMRVKKSIHPNSSFDIQYLWHFTNHRIQWHTIEEPQTEYNIEHKIKVHDDLNRHVIGSFIANNGFRLYCEKNYFNKHTWSGCFGCCCFITYSFLEKMEAMTNITDIMMNMNSNRLRRSIESIFSLACQYTLGKEIHDSFDGLYFDGFKGNNMESDHIKKISFNRQ